MASCNAASLIDTPDFTFAGIGVKAGVTSGRLKHILLTRCDISIADITDGTEYTTQLTANRMVLSPEITEGTIPFPSTSDEIQINCRPPVALRKDYELSFKSYSTDTTSATDTTDWDLIDQTIDNWYIAMIDCDNNILVPQEVATSQELGFQMNGNIGYVIPDAAAAYFEAQLTFTYDRVIKRVPLDATVITALGL